MIKFLKQVFGRKQERTNGFYDFLVAPSRERTKVIKKAIRQSDEDQREVVRQYKRNLKAT